MSMSQSNTRVDSIMLFRVSSLQVMTKRFEIDHKNNSQHVTDKYENIYPTPTKQIKTCINELL